MTTGAVSETGRIARRVPDGAQDPAANDRRRPRFPAPGLLKPPAPFVAQLLSQDQRRLAVADGARRAPTAETAPAEPAPAALPVPARRKGDLAAAQRRHFEQVNAYRKTESMAAEFIIRRYRLAADFQGVILADISTVEMTV